MGSYRGEYENYYQSISGKKQKVYKDARSNVNYNENNEDKNGNIYTKDTNKKGHESLRVKDIIKYFVNINLVNIAACTVIASLLYASKAYPSGQAVYDYIKDVSKVSFYYKDMITEDSNLVFNVIDDVKNTMPKSANTEENSDVIKPFDSFKVVKKSSIEILKSNSVVPLSGTLVFGEIQGIKEKYIFVSSNDAKVKNVYKGTVKEIGTDDQLGEFIVINSADGVDIKYSNINSITKKVGDEVTTGEVIADVTNNEKTKIKGVVLQVIDGGEYKDPKEYINVK